MSPLDAIQITLARVREKLAELQIEERVLSRLLVELAGRAERPAPVVASRAIETKPSAAAPPVRQKSFNGTHLRSWTKDEDQVLRDRWPAGGMKGIRDLLPNRTPSAIYQRAKTLGIKRVFGAAPAPVVKPTPVPERKLSFAQLLERVSRGEVGIADKLVIPAGGCDRTLGGVVGEIT